MGFLRSLLKNIGSPETAEKPGSWIGPYAEALGGRTRAPDHPDEEGFIDGAGSDGISWTLRVLNRKESDGDCPFEFHYLLWHTDAVRLADVILVFGSSGSDADLWRGLDGITVRAEEIDSQLEDAFGNLERLVQQHESGTLSEEGFLSELSRTDQGGPMSAFVDKAKPFALPHPLSAPWHALTTDVVAAARLLTPAVVVRVEEWSARCETYESWLRAWVGGPNVRLETYLIDPNPQAYRSVVDLGIGLTRAAQALMASRHPHSEGPCR